MNARLWNGWVSNAQTAITRNGGDGKFTARDAMDTCLTLYSNIRRPAPMPDEHPIVKCKCGTESRTLYYYGYCPDCGEWR